MKLAGIIIIVGILWYLSSLKKKDYFYNTMTSLTLLMATIQAPLFYYYSTGLLSFFVISFYVIIGVGLTYFLFPLNDENRKTKTIFQKYGVYATIIIGTVSLFWGQQTVEKIDWKLRRGERERIVARIKVEDPKTTYYKLEEFNFPPISNGGNEILIDKRKNGKFIIEFYIDRGFIDHYSAFVYTNDSAYENELKSSVYARQLDKNWYKISK
jgi:hypothetical protein